MKDELPIEFQNRVRKQLGEEYEEFIISYENPPAKGIRINTLKTNKAPCSMEPIPWIKGGYYASSHDDLTGSVKYRAGLYYIQEPSAMTPADRLPISKGDKVLDLCAAPGGKATALACKLNGTGILVANEVSESRCRTLLHNLEKTGAANIIVTNELPRDLKKKFPNFFNKIMVDAPCSGEGMFRKNPEAMRVWSPERVHFFAKQQKSILESAVEMLAAGGLLMYSTCTFSPEENEGSVSSVLERFPEMELIDIDGYTGFSKGVPEYGNSDECLRKTVRIWPHKMNGEGHFLALFRKKINTSKDGSDFDKKKKVMPGNRIKKNRYNNSFCAKERCIMDCFLENLNVSIKKCSLENKNGKVYMIPFDTYNIPKLKIFRCGLFMGELKKNRFEPSQALAFHLPANGFNNKISFSASDPRIFQYFNLESVLLNENETAITQDGTILLETEEYPVGFGKRRMNVIKSKYLRLK